MGGKTQAQVAGRGRGTPRWPAAIIAGLTLIFYIPLFFNSFTTWDDSSTIWGNPSFNPPTPGGILHYWAAPFMDLYVPVTYTLWGLLSFVAYSPAATDAGTQLSVTPFHMANLALHIGAAVLVYVLIYQLLKAHVGHSGIAGQEGYMTAAALAGALLFALHPVQVESVAWISGTKDVLYSLLSLAAILAYVRGGRSVRWYLAATLLFAMALLSKPTAVVVPGMALIVDLMVTSDTWRGRLLRLVPWLVMSAIVAEIAKMVQPGHFVAEVPWQLRPLVAIDAIGFYLRQIVLPITLVIDYGRAPAAILQAGVVWWPVLIAVVSGSTIFVARKAVPALLPAAGLLLLPLLPVLGFVPFDFQAYSTVADHYLYLAMLGVALAVAAMLWVCRRYRAVWIIAAIAIVMLGARTFAQIRTWRDSQTLFTHVIKTNPLSWPAGNNLAIIALERGDPATAIHHIETALVRRPPHPDLYVTAGRAYTMVGRLEDAQRAYDRAVEIDATDATVWSSLAAVVAQRGDREKGMQLARKAIEIDPKAAEPHMNLGIMLAEGGDNSQAAMEVAKAVELAPSNADARINLGILLWELGSRAQAIQQIQAAIRLRPADGRARQILQEMQSGQF